MCNIKQEQKGSLGSSNMQIGEQNNYYGLTPQKASEIAIKLFMDNFPEMMEECKTVAKERATECAEKTIQKYVQKNGPNCENFKDVDVMYTFWEAQKSYARSGDIGLLDMLSTLVANRAENIENSLYNITLNQAVLIVSKLTPLQINTLTFIHFINKNLNGIPFDKKYIQIWLNRILRDFSDLRKLSGIDISYLNSIGCAQSNILWLDLDVYLAKKFKDIIEWNINFDERFSYNRNYNITLKDNPSTTATEFFCNLCPELKNAFSAYNHYLRTLILTPVSIVIAEINFTNKTGMPVNTLSLFLKD